jgi:L-lactate permease
MLREAGNVAALLGILWAANAAGFVDIAGILAAGTLFAFTGAYDRLKGRAPLDAGVFGAFALFIVAIRIIPGITELLRSLWIIEFTEDLPAFAPFAHPSFWLIVFGFGYAYWKSVPIFETIQISGRAFRAAYVPVAVTIGFVVLGQGISALGAQKEAVLLLGEISGSQSVYFGPIFAALAGWLTGSNAAAHGMLAEFQAALGAATGENPIHTVAIQNVVASAYTMLSPMRIALVATALGLVGKEAEILRLLTPFAAVVLIIAWAATALT